MKSHFLGALALVVSLACQLTGQSTGPIVRFHTTLGDIDVQLRPDAAPKTVANFLTYVNSGAYNNSIIHRSVAGFVFQGGGYNLVNHQAVATPANAPVVNEFKISNTRGTISMAKTSTGPNTATNQWFFNEADNSANLDTQNGGFTVFGTVLNNDGLAVMDAIAAVPVVNLGSPFDSIPLVNYDGTTVADSNLVLVLTVAVLSNSAQPTVADNGIIGASGFGGLSSVAPGSYVEIYGTNLGPDPGRGWAGTDFVNGNAPTSLDGVTVTINGQPAFVNFISPGQVNVQVPANVPTGKSVPVVVTYQGQSSPAKLLAISGLSGSLLAPASFNVGGKQFVAALHANTGMFVSNGSIPGTTAAPAVPGETLVIYGMGFGPVTPSSTAIAGQVVQGQSSLTTPVQFNFGPSVADVTYAGLVAGLVGVDQFNIVVPNDAPFGDVPLTVSFGGRSIAQTLYLTVKAQ